MAMNPDHIGVFVFYLDSFFSKGKNLSEISLISEFAKKYKCFVITRKKEIYEDLYGCGNVEFIPWEFQYPNVKLHKTVLEKTGLLYNLTAYVSDDFEFLKNTRSYTCFSVHIKDTCYLSYEREAGFCSDVICRSLSELNRILADKVALFIGEQSIETKDNPKGRVIQSIYSHDGYSVSVVAAGRYYGSNHYMHIIDVYSRSLYVNKKEGSQLCGKFDFFFSNLFTEMVKDFIVKSGFEIHGFTNVPDKPGKKNKFESITPSVCNSLELNDLSMNFKCIKKYSDNKFYSEEDRRKNVKGAYAYDGDLSGQNIILIDDIITTGATLMECVDVLKSKGAEEVFIFVLGINQFSCSYWKNDSYIYEFANNNYLNFNSKTMLPFYGKCKEAYVAAVSSLFSRTNREILDFDDDDSFSLESF